jgi:hypothetical protein
VPLAAVLAGIRPRGLTRVALSLQPSVRRGILPRGLPGVFPGILLPGVLHSLVIIPPGLPSVLPRVADVPGGLPPIPPSILPRVARQLPVPLGLLRVACSSSLPRVALVSGRQEKVLPGVAPEVPRLVEILPVVAPHHLALPEILSRVQSRVLTCVFPGRERHHVISAMPPTAGAHHHAVARGLLLHRLLGMRERGDAVTSSAARAAEWVRNICSSIEDSSIRTPSAGVRGGGERQHSRHAEMEKCGRRRRVWCVARSV